MIYTGSDKYQGGGGYPYLADGTGEKTMGCAKIRPFPSFFTVMNWFGLMSGMSPSARWARGFRG